MRRVDPGGGWLGGRYGRVFDEALGVGDEGGVQRRLAGGMDGVGLAVVNLVWRHQAQACVVMGRVIPGEEVAAELFGILDAAEAFREPWLIFQGLEVAFRERVVVRHMWSAVRFGDAQIADGTAGGR